MTILSGHLSEGLVLLTLAWIGLAYALRTQRGFRPSTIKHVAQNGAEAVRYRAASRPSATRRSTKPSRCTLTSSIVGLR